MGDETERQERLIVALESQANAINRLVQVLEGKAERRTSKRARQTVANALNLCRVALESAIEAGHIEANPARDVRVSRVARTDDRWTWLKSDEIDKLLSDRTEDEQRDIYTVAIYTGLRAGELFGLEWRDVDLKHATATIRHSWNRTPTKRGELRTLHLFAPVVEALERQHERSGKRSHVFPARDGEPRTRDQMPRIEAALEAVGVKRHVRFHDLRHTCASHLVSGTWGRAWTIEEVAKHLGHSTSATTRRYAHLCPEGLAKADRETLVGGSPKEVPSVPKRAKLRGPQVPVISGGEGIRTPGTLAGSPVFKTARDGQSTREVSGSLGTFRGRARALLEGLRDGTTTAEEVAELAAEYLARPDPVRRAAERFAVLAGTEHEGMAAAQFLAALLESEDSAGERESEAR